MKAGYARVSTKDQAVDLQVDALKKAGCTKVYTEVMSGTCAVIFAIVRVSPKAATDAYNTVQEFTDPNHGECDPLSIEQRAIVERYSATYSKIQLLRSRN